MCSVSATEEESWLTWPIASLDLYQSHTAIAVGTKETSAFFAIICYTGSGWMHLEGVRAVCASSLHGFTGIEAAA